MVSSIAIAGMICTLLLSLLSPFILLILLARKRKGIISAWLLGMLGFFIPQLVIRIPALQLLAGLDGFQAFTKAYPLLYIIILALTAGLFETAGRLAVLRLGLKRRLSFGVSLAAGAGHGAIESIALIGLTYVNNLAMSLMINAGLLDKLLPDTAMAETVKQALTGTEPSLFFAAGLERVLTMIFHMAMSVLLGLMIARGRAATGFILVTLLHGLVDFSAAGLGLAGLSPWALEGVILLVALLSLALIFWLRPRFPERPPEPPAA